MGWNPVNEAKKWFNKVKNEAQNGINQIRDGVNSGINQLQSKAEESGRWLDRKGSDVGGQVWQTGQDVQKQVESKAKDVTGQAVKEIQGAVATVKREAIDEVEAAGKAACGKVEAAVTEKLPDLIVTALQDLASEAMKPALKVAAATARQWRADMTELREEDPELVGAIDALGFDVELKVNVALTLDWAGFYTRSEQIIAILDRAGNDGIAVRRRDIIGFVEAIGPTSIKLGVGASVSLGVDAGVKTSVKAVPLKLFTRLGDRALKARGCRHDVRKAAQIRPQCCGVMGAGVSASPGAGAR